jgi:hypothetical protein
MHRDLRPPRTSIRWTSIAATSTAIGVLAAGGLARAESAEAEALFNDGNQRMAEGKLAEACDAFEASNRAEPRAGTLLHLGACRERNHQLAAAWSAYKDALTRAKDPVKRDVAAARVAAIEPRLSYLTVSLPEPSRLDGMTVMRNGAAFDPSLWNRPLPVDGGDYVIAARAPDHEDWQVTVHIDVEDARLSVSVPRLNARPGPGAAPAQLAAASPPSGFTTRRKIAIGAAGVAIAGGAAGVALGLLAGRNQSEVSATCPSPAQACMGYLAANAAIRSSYREALAANVAYGIAAAAAIGAGALWFTGAPDADDAPRVRVAPSLVPSEPGIVVMGRF